MEWWDYETDHTLIIYDSKSLPMLYTNVGSLDDAANFLGQYGWEYVNSESHQGEKIYHMKRKAQVGGTFFLAGLSEKELKK